MADLRRVPVVLFGVGGVGRALVEQIVHHRALHVDRYGVALDLIALCDSSAILPAQGAFDDESLLRILELKSAGSRLAEWDDAIPERDPLAALKALDPAYGAGLVVVDCTATEATAPALLHVLDEGARIVLANKKPLTIDQEGYNRLTRAGATAGPLALDRARWETTCGAGLPVIVTLQRLLLSGDPVERIAGTFSGTLGYVMTGLEQGRSFSDVVREAHQLGYTEPDPRDDLGGIDVARKALILARGLGWELDMSDVEVQGLYPQEMDQLSVAEFLSALPQLNSFYVERVQAARQQGGALRFAALVEGGRCVVGPTVAPLTSPLGRLSGTDNLLEFHTGWYTPTPLVVQGRGAGVQATAAGVLSDLMELALLAA